MQLKAWRRLRWIIQAGFVALVFGLALRHQLAPPGTAASLHSLCPFGAVASIGTIITSGTFAPKLHPSNLVLGVGLLLSLAVVGPVFCGWVCPLGAVQDFLAGIRQRLGVREHQLPRWAHNIATWLKYIILGLIIWKTLTAARLVFGPYDPYYTLFSLEWLYEPEEVMPISLAVTGAVLAGAWLVRRSWCRYLCPLGALAFLTQRISLLRLRTATASCRSCRERCRSICVTGSLPGRNGLSEPCVMCLDCVTACARGSVELTVGPGKPQVTKQPGLEVR